MSYLLNIKVDLFSIVDLLSVGLQVLLSQSTHIHPAVSACLTALPSALSTVGTRTNKAVLAPGLMPSLWNGVNQVTESMKNHGLDKSKAGSKQEAWVRNSLDGWQRSPL